MNEPVNFSHYYFIPSVRQGLAAKSLIREDTEQRARLKANVRVRAYAKDTGEDQEQSPISKDVYLYGPGDILGFDPRIVSRTEPQADVSNFEYNYFPAIEFADPDFPWRFTPENPEIDSGKLQPWLVLVVLVAESSGGDIVKEFEEDVPDSPNLPACIRVDSGLLPDLQYSWRWAHAQVTGGNGLSDAYSKKTRTVNTPLEDLVTNTPERAVSRLLCARRLRPNVHYSAFVVPAFELGLQAALGSEVDPSISALDPAWSSQMSSATDKSLSSGKLKLPYYYRWEFRTGELADFEYLVRLLEPRKLTGVGIRNIDCVKPGFGRQGVNRAEAESGEKAFLGMEGALMAEDTEPTPWGMDNQHAEPLRHEIASLINGKCCTETVSVSPVAVAAVSGSRRAVVSWTSSAATTALIEYGLLPSYGHRRHLKVCQLSHKIVLDGLLTGRVYYFRIITQTSGGSRIDSTGSFTIPMLPCVTPPIYGRWHRATDRVDPETEGWIDELNLDPRHRAAAGLGAEVIRFQQEELMAGAWDQLGPIESVNDGLRRAQFAREVSKPLFRRIKSLPMERVIKLMAPAMRRIIVLDPDAQTSVTATHYLHSNSSVSGSLVDSSFRCLLNPFGPVLSRHRLFQRQEVESPLDENLLSRLSMGDPKLETKPTAPMGTMSPFHVSNAVKNHLSPTSKMDLVFDTPAIDLVPRALNTGLSMFIRNSGKERMTVKDVRLADDFNNSVRLRPHSMPFFVAAGESKKLQLILSPKSGQEIFKGKIKLIIETDDPDDPIQEISIESIEGSRNSIRWVIKKSSLHPAQDPRLKFSDGRINSQDIQDALIDNPFAGMSGIPDPQKTADSITKTVDWLNRSPSVDFKPSERPASFLSDLKDKVFIAMNPETTLNERARSRLKLNSELAWEFDHEVNRDLLRPIMWAPEFASPMYEPLSKIAHHLLLPGVEKIPQNTLGILYVNRRFIESYLCGLNHEFAGELLWRGFPTDQRGSCFRQFWDVSRSIPNSAELTDLLQTWLKDPDLPLKTAYGNEVLEHLLKTWLEKNNYGSITELSQELKEQILTRHRDEVRDVSQFTETQRTALVEFLITRECLDEKLKDIRPMTQWSDNPLGKNHSGIGMMPVMDEPKLVLVICGELLKRYPDASIYAIDSNDLPNAQSGEMHSAVRPLFEATLPPDLRFFGFPFTKNEALGDGGTNQKYFVIEEQVSYTHFGLDETGGDLSWDSIDLDFGSYMDSAISARPTQTKGENELNVNTSSATLASITLQVPVRVFVPANRMIRN